MKWNWFALIIWKFSASQTLTKVIMTAPVSNCKGTQLQSNKACVYIHNKYIAKLIFTKMSSSINLDQIRAIKWNQRI